MITPESASSVEVGRRSLIWSRRRVLASATGLPLAPAFARSAPQRVVVLMMDGFGLEYFESNSTPTLQRWSQSGLFAKVQAEMPTVTNTNNASICCGVAPDQHGITGNSYLNESTGREEFMETADLLLAPTLFERAARVGVKSALLSSKKKTVGLLPRGTDFAVTAEAPPADWIKRFGPAPPIYSREINYWLLTAAIDVLKTRPGIRCLYVHTTDYPMHMWPPEAKESKEHLRRLDHLLEEAAAAAPDAAFLLSADHGMNSKKVCRDLAKACANRGAPVRIAIEVERDKYPKHHRGFGGVSWIYCSNRSEIDRTARVLSEVPGVEQVLTRAEAVKKFRLLGSRIGDLVVLGDKDTVFGELQTEEELMPPEYRTHGSLHENSVPLLIHNAEQKVSRAQFTRNRDLTRWLFS